MSDLLLFGADSSTSSAEINPRLREQIEGEIDAFLQSEEVKRYYNRNALRGAYEPVYYKELLLTIAGALNVAGNSPGTDIFRVRQFFDADYRIDSSYQSCWFMYHRLIKAENAYARTHAEAADIYVVDHRLQVVIQGALFGPDYASATDRYSAQDAKDYYKAHKEQYLFHDTLLFRPYEFADRVSTSYHVVKVIGHTTVTY